MSSTIRKFKREQDKSARELITEDQKRLPTGTVVTSPVKGEFTTFPLLGWVGIRAKEETPLLMLALALLKDDRIRGTLNLELPVYEGETDKAVLATIDRYGWDGRVWSPGAKGWPTGDEANEEQIKMLLDQAGLKATLTFPPDFETGNINAQPLDVRRARGPFFLEPLPQPEVDPDPERLTQFLELCRNPGQFHRLN